MVDETGGSLLTLGEEIAPRPRASLEETLHTDRDGPAALVVPIAVPTARNDLARRRRRPRMSSRSWMILSRRSSDAITFERTCCADSPSNLQSPNLTGIGSASTSRALSDRGSHRCRLPPVARASGDRCGHGHDGARPGACVACTADSRRACSWDPCACGVPSEGWLHDSPPRWSPVGAARVGGLGRRPSATTRCSRDRPARRLVARLAALRVGRGLGLARAGSEASWPPAGETAGAHASVRLRGARPDRSARRLGGLARIWRVSRPRAPFAAAVLRRWPAAFATAPVGG